MPLPAAQEDSYFKYLDCARHFKCIMHYLIFHLQRTQQQSQCSFFGWGNWGLERLNSIP